MPANERLSDQVSAAVFNSSEDLFHVAVSGTGGFLSRRVAASNVATELGKLLPVSGLQDVTIIALSANQVLEYDGSAWVNIPFTPANILNDLNDVNITATPTNNQVLAYNSTTGRWQQRSLGTGPHPLALEGDSTHSDVSVSNIAGGQGLVWNGSQWVNEFVGLVGSDTEFITFASTTDVSGNLTATRTAIGAETFTWSLSGFSGDGYEADNVKGVYVYCANTQGVRRGGMTLKVNYTLPDGTVQEIYQASGGREHIRSDSTITLLPINIGQDTIEIEMSVAASTPNTFTCQLVGVSQTVTTELTPNVDIIHVKGTTSQTTSAFIDSSQSAIATIDNWSSLSADQTFTDWSTILPITVPANTTKTELSLIAGAEAGTGAVEPLFIDVTIDWINQTVVGAGYFMLAAGATSNGHFAVSGITNTELEFFELGPSVATDLPKIETGIRSIVKLPTLITASFVHNMV